MTAAWSKRGEQHELRSHEGRVHWATIRRECPYYRIRLLNGPGTPLKKAASLTQAKHIAEDWYIKRMA